MFEMLQGDVIHDGWRSEHVKEALDLCLACKGCKGDCPVNVDVATYKAEFLAHYYEGRLRPRSAYAMGLIDWWAWLASWTPRLANFVGQAPGLSAVVKWLGGIDQRRRLPRFAEHTFRDWFRRRGPRNDAKPQVILWADTFTNYFHPDIGRAAVDVLETAGFQVLVPERALCCGRPLYDYGMLDRAKRLLHDILDVLRPWIAAGVPIVGLEPSCVAVFRDELVNLLADDPDARRLQEQTFLLSEFLEQKANDFELPRLEGKAIVHGHCHHKAVLSTAEEEAILKKLGLDYEILDSGCCGMAGSFGFEKGEHYDVSMACGERVLLPAVRSVSEDTLIIADGFSCHEQIAQATDRRALHLAQVLRLALRGGDEGNGDEMPVGGRAAAGLAWGAGPVVAGFLLGRWLAGPSGAA